MGVGWAASSPGPSEQVTVGGGVGRQGQSHEAAELFLGEASPRPARLLGYTVGWG